MVFQDPQESMNPKFSLWESIGDPLASSKRVPRSEVPGEIRRAAGIVGLDDESLAMMPGECSAELVQRASIARALVVRPHLLILDEPTTSLDADARSAVLELIHELRGRGDTSVLLVTHDLSAVRTVTDSLYIMYLGSVMEQGPTKRLFERPLHPYTRALLGSHLEPDPTRPPQPMELLGEIPDPSERPPGCPLAPRCPWATEESIAAVPALEAIEGGHRVACVRALEFAASGSVPHAAPATTNQKGTAQDE
jgi:oligopeptide/dipeptide ABC transporter ATP-binding protein